MQVVGDIGVATGAWLLVCVPGVVFLAFAGRRREVGRLLWRLAPVAVFYGIYSALVGWSQRTNVVLSAVRNGEGIARAERDVHVFLEPWLSAHALPGFTAFYDWGQVLVVVGLLVYLAVSESDVYWRLARNSLALIAGGGFLCFWLVPVAPPWVLPASYGIHSAGLVNLRGVGELLGAFPSLHTAWAGWAAAVCWAILPGRWRWLGVVNLALTAWVVLATGNHYVVDVAGGEVLALSACGVASWWSLRRDVRPDVLVGVPA